MTRIEWTEPALVDLEEIRDYISKDSPFYATRFIERIFNRVEKLADFKEIGRHVPEAGDRADIRELIFQGYRIIYLVEDDKVKILTVVNGSKELSKQADSLKQPER